MMPCYSKTSNGYLIVFFISCLWEVLLLSGITYGWASIVVVFKENQFFLDLCHESNNGSSVAPVLNASGVWNGSTVGMGSVYVNPNDPGCSEQNERLNLIFTIAVVFLCCVKFPVGIFLDAFGPRLTRVLGCAIYTMACIGLAFTEREYANILFPVFILICVGGSLNVLSLYQVCNVVFRNTKSLVLCMLHGAFDSSAVVLLLFKLAYDGGIRLRDVSLFYVAISALTVSVSTVFLIPPRDKLLAWNKSPEELKQEAEDAIEEKNRRFSSNSLQGETFLRSGSFEVERNTMIVYKPLVREKPQWKSSIFQKYGSAANNNRKGREDDTTPICSSDDKETEEPEETFGFPGSIWACVFSPSYLLELVYLSFVQLKLWFFVGSVNQYLEVLTNDNPDQVSLYVDLFGYIQLCGIIVTPFIGAIFDKNIFLGITPVSNLSLAAERIKRMKGAVLPFVITSQLCLLLCALSLVKSLKVMIPCFVLYAIVRGFMYSNHGAYIGIAFPAQYFGRLYGLGVFTAGIFGLLQYALFVISTNYLNGDPFWMNLILLVLVIGTNALPIYIYTYCNRAIRSGILNQPKNAGIQNDCYT